MRKIERTVAPSDNTRVAARKEFVPIPLNRDQKQNLKIYGTLNKPETKQTELSQGRKLSPGEQEIRDKKLAKQSDLEEYQKRKEEEARDLEQALVVAPYVIPVIGQAMWAGKAIDLAVSGASDGKYKSWGNMVDQKTGSGEFIGELTNPGYYAVLASKLATPLVKKSIQRIPINYSNYSNLRSIEIPRFKSFTNSFNDQKALQTASDQFTNRNTFYRGVKGAQNLDEATQMLTTVDGKIRPSLRQGVPEGNNSGVIYSSVNPKRAEVFARNQGYVGKVTPVQIKGNNLTEFIDNNLIGNRKDLIFNKQIDGTPQLISFGNHQQQVMNLQGFVGSSNKLPITKPLINRNTNTIRKTTLNKSEIDWSKWNSEIPANKPLMQEYHVIEQTAKQNGTWMKNPDGSTFKGTPEQFVQQNSDNFKKAFPNPVLDESGNIQYNYHGSPNKFDTFDESKFKNGMFGKGIYTSPNKSVVEKGYAKPKEVLAKDHIPSENDNLYTLYIDAKNQRRYVTTEDFMEDTNYADITHFGKTKKDFPTVDDIRRDYPDLIKEYNLNTDEKIRSFYNNSFAKSKNILRDQFNEVLPDVDSLSFSGGTLNPQVTPFHKARIKSAIGNNGMFDMTNPNIYKGLIPAAGFYELTQPKKQYKTRLKLEK